MDVRHSDTEAFGFNFSQYSLDFQDNILLAASLSTEQLIRLKCEPTDNCLATSLKFGLLDLEYSSNTSPRLAFEALRIQIQIVAKSGFHSVWVDEHHSTNDVYFPNILTLASLVSLAPSLAPGTAISIPALHDPLTLAEETAALDVFSGGKMIFGVGLGYRVEEFAAHGISGKQRVGRFEEALTVIQKLWAGDTVNHEGKFYKLYGASINPTPLQKPRPPIWVGAFAKSAIRCATQIGDTWLISPLADTDTVKKQIAEFRVFLRESGKDASKAEIPLMRECYVARTDEEAKNAISQALLEKYRLYIAWGIPPEWGIPSYVNEVGDSEELLERLRRDRFVVGSSEDCVEQISRLRSQINPTHLLLRIQIPGMSHEVASRAIRLMGRKVIPYFES